MRTVSLNKVLKKLYYIEKQLFFVFIIIELLSFSVTVNGEGEGGDSSLCKTNKKIEKSNKTKLKYF